MLATSSAKLRKLVNAMKKTGFFQRLLSGCFGREQTTDDSELEAPRKEEDVARPAALEAPSQSVQHEPPPDEAGAESSHTASERQQSDQSQSEATQPTTQPTSVETSSKVDSDLDEITATKPAPQPGVTVTTDCDPTDPDAITPVDAPMTKYVSVKEALIDRQKLYDRLRRRPVDQTPSTAPPSTSQQATGGAPKVEQHEAADGELSSS